MMPCAIFHANESLQQLWENICAPKLHVNTCILHFFFFFFYYNPFERDKSSFHFEDCLILFPAVHVQIQDTSENL